MRKSKQEMVTKSVIKFIKSLKIKKYRDLELMFLVEGSKSVLEVIRSDFDVQLVLASEGFLDLNSPKLQAANCELHSATLTEIESAGSLKTNDSAIAVCRMKPNEKKDVGTGEFGLVLDGVSDPGNLGTLLRIADWYGIKKVICSETTADFYNPKVIQASMGSFTRVVPFYTSLIHYLEPTDCTIYGTFIQGDSVHQVEFEKRGLILLGSESHGISPDLEGLVNRRIAIPGYGRAESLNVAIAAAVICDNLRRITG